MSLPPKKPNPVRFTRLPTILRLRNERQNMAIEELSKRLRAVIKNAESVNQMMATANMETAKRANAQAALASETHQKLDHMRNKRVVDGVEASKARKAERARIRSEMEKIITSDF